MRTMERTDGSVRRVGRPDTRGSATWKTRATGPSVVNVPQLTKGLVAHQEVLLGTEEKLT